MEDACGGDSQDLPMIGAAYLACQTTAAKPESAPIIDKNGECQPKQAGSRTYLLGIKKYSGLYMRGRIAVGWR